MGCFFWRESDYNSCTIRSNSVEICERSVSNRKLVKSAAISVVKRSDSNCEFEDWDLRAGEERRRAEGRRERLGAAAGGLCSSVGMWPREGGYGERMESFRRGAVCL